MSFACRQGCGACCTVISITGPIPGLDGPKPAGVRCPQLDQNNLCKLFGSPLRPDVCNQYQASQEFCGDSNAEAHQILTQLEIDTN